MEDWRLKLAQKFHTTVPEEKTEEKDWKAEYEEAENRQKRNKQQGKKRQRGNRDMGKEPASMASAPYNFVSLPPKMVTAPLNAECHWAEVSADERVEHYKDYIDREGKLSGYIDVTLTTVTPCFVGGEGEGFFAPAGRPVIPGSTIRGMVKNLFKIITAGAMRRKEDLDDRHLYFRSMAGKLASFRDYYRDRMIEKDEEGNDQNKTQAGFLIRVKHEYFICPADMKKDQGMRPKEPCIIWHDKEQSADCITGRMNGKKHFYRVLNADWRKEARLPVASSVIEDYKNDSARKGLNLFDNPDMKKDSQARGFTHLDDVDFVTPCFYVAEQGEVKHFGHGRYYRIPYETSIGDHVPDSVQNEEGIDFADAVFGRKEFWAGRVAFEDAEAVGQVRMEDSDYAHPLMTPNPTSFQLYLEQDGWPPKHWDDRNNPHIRGYKLYWHQNIRQGEWKFNAAAGDKKITGMQKIQPVTVGSVFKGRIRFRHLSKEELGAILSVFHLQGSSDHDIVYKIGRGKSIGMGSIRIKSSLFLEDEAQRYRSLFSAHGWQEGMTEGDGIEYIHAFEDYRKSQLTPAEEKQFEDAMEELRTLMDWNNVNCPEWKEKTAMMPIDDKTDTRYKDRVILDDARDFVKKHFKKDNR